MCIPFHTPLTRIPQTVSVKLKKKRNGMCIPFQHSGKWISHSDSDKKNEHVWNYFVKLFQCTLKTKTVSQFWWNGSCNLLLKSIKIHRQPFLKWITNLKTLLNWPNGEDGFVELRRRKPEKGGRRWTLCGRSREELCGGCVRECVGQEQTWEKTEEECVEAVWEKRRMREKRLHADQQLGQRFLMGCSELDSCFIEVCFGDAERQAFLGCAVKKHSNSYFLP